MLSGLLDELAKFERVVSRLPEHAPAIEGALCSAVRGAMDSVERLCRDKQAPGRGGVDVTSILSPSKHVQNKLSEAKAKVHGMMTGKGKAAAYELPPHKAAKLNAQYK
eukprot:CAMPEP_0182858842 /NCGR_PEP_ID=MMETSP0034_2-20130328/3923_1 /TAXON_ID=156128 /ORGANISM="Nephroselmis pyriformis, Strain CCMP717" /LENGTH=107 /DNA_ID=CAMNT_0024990331 /DNA_START=114 /DNA_END=434 /DNA_ORIENTATION=+